TTTTATASAESEEPSDKYFAVIHARVHTVTGPVLEDATVLCKNGRIEAIGADVRLPDDCEVLDARGMNVYPGLVAAGSSGIFGGGDPRDSTNLFGLNMTLGLAAGITTALAGNDVGKLTYGTTEGMLLRRNAFVNLRYDAGRPLDKAQLRADLQRVRDYLRDVRRYEIDKQRDEDAKPPEKDWLKGKYENYRKLLAGEAVAIAAANRAAELLDYADLSERFGFHLVLRGAVEGWTVADRLGRAGIDAIVTPRATVPPDERTARPTGSTIENAAKLREHGVTVAVVPGSTGIALWGLAGRDLFHLNMEAAFAVRGGMSNDDAIRAITIDAARILGVDDQVGSLEVGKDADMLVCDGDLLHFMTQVHYTIVNGVVAYDKSNESLFAHIRPEGEPAPVQFDDIWPRRLEWRD
ncbi:MAG: hypothetical protein D6744_04005, partial [Planctomycetota bacterium]